MTTAMNGDQPDSNDIRSWATYYREQGMGVCRIRQGEKRPTDVKWTHRSAEPEEFGPDDNIGLMCGWASDGGQHGQFLVCVDIDAPATIAAADEHLPPTGAIEGHPGKPRSHRWYLATGVPPWATSTAEGAVAGAQAAGREPGPFLKHFRHAETGEGMFDLIGSGGQAVAPPSRRDDGTRRTWEPDCGIGKAATIRFEDLWAGVIRFAKAIGAKVPDVGPDDTPVAPAAPAEPVAVARPTSKSASRPAHAKGACSRCDDVPMDERVKRCGRYLEWVDLAHSGHGGHDTTWRAARIIVIDFAVDDRERALALLRDYNQWLRIAGEETWSEAELAHKIDDALRAGPDPKWPRGFRLSESVDDGSKAWDDPARLADGFLQVHTVRFVKQTVFEYQDGAYRVVSDEWLAARVRGFIERAAARQYARRRRAHEAEREKLTAILKETPPGPHAPTGAHTVYEVSNKEARAALSKLEKSPPPAAAKVTKAMVANTIEAIAVRTRLPDKTDLDTWVDGRSATPVLSVENGLLDPVARTLVPHDTDWLSTAKLPVTYDPNAPKPAKWLALLDQLMQGDAEKINVIQEMFGACLDRGLNLKWFGALSGPGDNGKSVVLAVLRFLLGEDNCSSVNLDELTTNRFAAFSLFGKLANIIGDQGHFESRDEGRLKTLTGGDLVTFEQKGKDPFSAVNRAKLIFAANSMPSFAEKTDAVWTRLIPVPFEYTVPAGKKNPALLTPEYWADELPGILNWALDGLARLRVEGWFSGCVRCELLKGQTRLDSNPARLFLTEEYKYAGNEADRITVDELYRSYKTWCDHGGYTRPLTKQRFGKEVRAAFPEVPESKTVRIGDTTAKCWIGLRKTAVTDVTTPAA